MNDSKIHLKTLISKWHELGQKAARLTVAKDFKQMKKVFREAEKTFAKIKPIIAPPSKILDENPELKEKIAEAKKTWEKVNNSVEDWKEWTTGRIRNADSNQKVTSKYHQYSQQKAGTAFRYTVGDNSNE